ncbi:MAG: hypothetical protein LBU27_01390 [Candidatus Peribacteria bacterium]|jgi:hypothetical protein|nr:hypothetical protein [Candidatus Peribacteria bacterium]
MDIEYWKEKLHRVRERKNDQSIAEMETAATNAIFKALKQYPYQYDKKNNGYQLSKILETKEIYCVGFSLLGHTFLDELQIKHKGLNIINHSALKVEIGNNLYFFDAASYDDRILPFKR